MEMSLKAVRSLVILAAVIAGLTPASDVFAWEGQGNPNPKVMPPHAYPFGKSYGEWSAEWWKWHFNLPAADHPVFSLDGANCGAGQSGKV